MRYEYAYRVPLAMQGFLNASPQPWRTGIRFIAFTLSGYHLITANENAISIDPCCDPPADDLSFSSDFSNAWVERALSPYSKIVEIGDISHVVVDDAREPMLSADGQTLFFIRDDRGWGRLMARTAFQSDAAHEVAFTSTSLNVYEASVLSVHEYAFAAADRQHRPQIFLTDAAHSNTPLALGESRFPALSADGRWMAYSHFQDGAWNLWVRDQKTGATRRIGNVPCNQIQPSWESDSKTLLYSSDCGRSLWFTAVSRRKVIP